MFRAAVKRGNMQEQSPDKVNIHYLNHVLDISERRVVEASENIVSGNGLNLLRKGARIDHQMKERLLEHKLRKPLETTMQVGDAVTADQVISVAESLLDKHPMLRSLYTKNVAKDMKPLLRSYATSSILQSMLTVYAEHREAKLEHAVSVSLLTVGMAQQLTPSTDERLQLLLMAGLFHDIGELYLQPALLARGVRLNPEQWRHIAAHPVIGQRVLDSVPGLSAKVGKIVLNHHERLDGYGYPNGLRGDEIPLDSQILGVAELLAGLLEAGRTPLTHAAVALKLIPGEFNSGVVDLVSNAHRACESQEAAAAELPPLNESLARVRIITTVVQRLTRTKARVAAELDQASRAFQALTLQAEQRLKAIVRSLSSTGLDSRNSKKLLDQLTAAGDVGVHRELVLVLKEVVWRLNELERELTMRVGILAPRESALLARLIDMLKPSKSDKAPPRQRKG